MTDAHMFLLSVNLSTRFTKLPKFASNSPLLRLWRSDHLKSVSAASGRLESR